jgi:ComF family protein
VACHRYGAWLCADCVQQVDIIRPPICPRCGWPLDEQASAGSPRSAQRRSGCDRCRSVSFQFDQLRAYAFYGGPLREAITSLKYRGLRALATPLGQLMAEGWPALSGQQAAFDVVVPMPLHRSRQRERGYNQASLLARELGARLGQPIVEDALVRIRATVPQVGLDGEARRANVRGAFQCTNAGLAGKRVLLVDDVCTTGATLEAASFALRKGGASSIVAYTLARAGGQTIPGPDESIYKESELWT